MSVESLPGKEQSERQRWEYKFLLRSRGIKGSVSAALGALAGATRDYANATEWEDLEPKAANLGEKGWELVNIVPRSSIAGGAGAGFTTDELWVFKRPKHNSPGQTQPAERTAEARTFSPEAREALEKKGYLIYLLQGKSMEELRREKGEPVLEKTQLDEWVNGEWVYHDTPGPFWTETTPATEAAINPNKVFLPGSDDKSFKYHQEIVETFSEEISKDIKGVKAIIGEASNYVELALLHRDSTRKRLFKLGNKFVYTATRTLYTVDGEDLVEVGEVSEDEKGVHCYKYNIELHGKYDTWIMPLVVPS